MRFGDDEGVKLNELHVPERQPSLGGKEIALAQGAPLVVVPEVNRPGAARSEDHRRPPYSPRLPGPIPSPHPADALAVTDNLRYLEPGDDPHLLQLSD